MPKNVTKAVIPAAGLGIRLRPLTSFTPKELLPVGGKPMIQYALEMYMAAGISEFCIIISPEKPQLKDFITGNWTPPAIPYEKDARFYKQLERCRIVFVTQSHPGGVADAVGMAKDFVGDEPFACIMPDCLLFSDRPHAQQLVQVFERYQKNVISTVFIRGADVKRFGNVGLLRTQRLDGESFLITSLSHKKPEPLTAMPGETIHKGFGGGIYLPEYFDLVEIVRALAKGEVDDVPIHQILIKQRKLLGVLLEGAAFDAGHPSGLRAAVHYAGRRTNSS
ncbi:MAG: NTP transferase domain-containing protein [Deltaproteobacteria bacterium]|nr:NTP transferase domain-containing protein [Deltaproteobacteria bacterium]MBW1794228.1 NTP transferase domain-containing protein [Deltaproteobacteria bacterium]MBW2331107.1 NTP transferase domain-containing protein [Deltaproteobacteria bacterium]